MDSKPKDVSSDSEANEDQNSPHEEVEKSHPRTRDGASPGKIFIGGLAKETSIETFTKHFDKYGEITDYVIMKDRHTGQPRGFGFVTYADPSVVDKVIQDTHVINGKQVEIKRTTPRGTVVSKDVKTKKIFVGGIPTAIEEDEFKNFFAKFGEVMEHQIMRDRSTGRSRGFGFITFDTEQAVDDILTKGNKTEFAGAQVEIKRAEPKKASNLPRPKHFSEPRPAFDGGFGDAYGDFGGRGAGGFGNSSFRSGSGGFGGARPGAYDGYYGDEFIGGYGRYGGESLGTYRGESSLGYSGRYGGSFGRGYDLGSYSRAGESYGGYGAGAGGYGSAYDVVGLGGGYGGGGGSSYGSRGGYGGSGSGRYHPYSR
ncbi:RNA-binding (RRM/RBD/RNP motifs) family protein [Tasmannia lanceolata]|uniref:RNA-binding (RRM/RBD/RNP motifs) family protein n=1 Tax=Tasmannia lanceolata TaxID=3420 RepID=UPI004063A5B4